MYLLQVFYGRDLHPREILKIDRPGDVLTRIPEALKAHEGCERIDVYAETLFLFAVDCQGRRLPGRSREP
jgi:hypothetical protein